MSSYDEQIKLIKSAKNYYDKYNKNKYGLQRNNFIYLSSFAKNIGFVTLQNLSNIKQNIFSNLKIILNDVFYGLYYGNVKIFHNKKIIKKYKKLIVTWSIDNQFESNGSFNDRYLNINSSSIKNTLWFIIYLSDKLPLKLKDNIVILKNKDKEKKSYFFFITKIFFSLKYIFFGKTFFLNKISSYKIFGDVAVDKIKNFFHKNIKVLFMPYEGQPFQNEIFSFSKKNFKRIKNIGYIHSPPLGLPANFIKKESGPDKLVVNGFDQQKCFSNLLGWKKKQIKVLPSRRFLKNSKKIDSFIFLPISFQSKKKIIESFKVLIHKEKLCLKNFIVRNHPGAKQSLSHNQLISELKKIILKNKNLKKKGKKFSIFIGSSGAIIEALERNINVFQICENPVLEKYSNRIWNSVIERKIDDNIFYYKIKKKNKLIILGNKFKSFENYFKY